MNMNKFIEVFDPSTIKGEVHIIGCGAIGSTLALMLARMGLETNINLYDFDLVESHNIANQQFLEDHIGLPKNTTVAMMMQSINSRCKPIVHEAYVDQQLTGTVFLCVDSIELRADITKKNMYNQNIKLFMDFRMELYSGQHYAADWDSIAQRKNFLRSMDFTDEEAKKNTPVSACNMTLSVMPTVETIVAFGVANFINFNKDKQTLRLMMSVNPFDFIIVD